MTLLSRIRSRNARVGVIGVGYVGLPLALEFARAGFTTTGIETDREKVGLLNSGRSYIQDVPDSDIRREVKRGALSATADYGAIADLDAISVCVPTPLRKTKDPDISYITGAVGEVVTDDE